MSEKFLLQKISTPFGAIEAKWTESKLLYSCLFASNETVKSSAPECLAESGLARLQHAFESYFDSGHFDWDFCSLDTSGLSPFQIRVLQGCAGIPSGTCWTYGQLAANAGSPKAARAVGMVMATNRWPIVVPCHRVVGANGKLVGYSGSGGLSTKRQLLELEQQQGSQLMLFS